MIRDANFQEKLSFLEKVLSKQHFFAAGKKKQPDDPASGWEAPCSYCEYKNICDTVPYHVMLGRYLGDSIQSEYFHLFS